MARPTKQGVDYFPLDVDLDAKLELYIADVGENGAAGFGVLITTWQLIYKDNGYFIPYDDNLFLLIRRRLLISVDEARAYIDKAIERGIFDKAVFNQSTVLTSRGLQKRYLIAAKKKKRITVVGNYLCFDVSDAANVLVERVSDAGNHLGIEVNDSNRRIYATKEEEEVKEEVEGDTFSFPPELNLNAWQEYLSYRRERKLTKLKPTSEQKQTQWLIDQGGHDIQQSIIDQTIKNAWQGLFALKESPHGQNETGRNTPSRDQRRHEVGDHIEREAEQAARAELEARQSPVPETSRNFSQKVG